MNEPDHKWVLEGIREKLDAGRIETAQARDMLVIPVGHGMAIHLHVEGTALKCAHGPEPGIDLHSPDSIALIVESVRKCIKWHVEYKGKEPIEDMSCHPCPLSSQDGVVSAIARLQRSQ